MYLNIYLNRIFHIQLLEFHYMFLIVNKNECFGDSVQQIVLNLISLEM